MSPLVKKRIAAVKTADAINAIEGAPISSYARSLSASWARGELTGEQMKQALLAHHRRIAEQERRAVPDPYLYEDVPVLKNELGIKMRKHWIASRPSNPEQI